MNKIEQLIEKYKKLLSEVPQKLDAMDAGFTAAFVMIIEDLQSLQEPTEEREDICLRCGVEHKEVKREGSGGCSSRGHNYPKHLWK